MGDPDFDVIVFGATSVTARRVTAYLEGRAPETGLTWAAAGRDHRRVAATLAEDGVTAPEIIKADVADPRSLEAMAKRAAVVLNLVGPYTRHGRPVIEACIAGGAHYVDLTGEIPFVTRVTREFDAPARDAGVKIVQVCGFEALPPDLGVLLAAEAAQERWQEDLADVDATIATQAMPPGMPRPSDLLSGGTMQSLAEAVGDPDAPAIRDPGCLIDDESVANRVRELSPIAVAPRRGPDHAAIAPMAPAAFINPAVIHRSAALSDPVRPPFRYREGFALEGGAATLPIRLAAAAALSAVQLGTGAAAAARPAMRQRVSRFLRKALPDSGFGPSADRLEQWRWRLTIRATTTTGNDVTVRVDGDGHPGYLATSRMLGEAGLLLATPGATPDRSGCLTPSLALGSREIGRFDAAGLCFAIV